MVAVDSLAFVVVVVPGADDAERKCPLTVPFWTNFSELEAL